MDDEFNSANKQFPRTGKAASAQAISSSSSALAPALHSFHVPSNFQIFTPGIVSHAWLAWIGVDLLLAFPWLETEATPQNNVWLDWEK